MADGVCPGVCNNQYRKAKAIYDADLAAYETLTTRLIDDPILGISRIVSHVALRPVRRFAGYPESLLSHKPR